MIVDMIIVIVVVFAFGLFAGHALGFGLRNRRADLHEPAGSRGEAIDRGIVGLVERHPRAASM